MDGNDVLSFRAKWRGVTNLRESARYFYGQHSGQFFGVGLEKSYPPHRVQVYAIFRGRGDWGPRVKAVKTFWRCLDGIVFDLRLCGLSHR